ncbi:MAG: hypothetical protein AAFO07_06395 [Bacteroidota bacterium]
MNYKDLTQQMDALVSKGQMVDAVSNFFAEGAKTSDYGKVTTQGRQKMVEKMENFIAGIAKVNGITHHHTIVDSNVSASEFTFDFDMKDGSKIYWHEIIRRIWDKDGKVAEEEYFEAQS